MNLESIDVAPLDVATELPDLRRDLHVFVDYVRAREVKRSHRGNALSKADAKRLAKLLSDPDAVREVDEEGSSAWIDFVDEVALQLGFVHYDTEGQYAGYTSQEPSFPDNYIEFRAKPYEQFLAAKAAKQESTLLELLVREGQGSASEFYRQGVLGRLDGFNHWGSATRRHAHARFPRGPPLPAGAAGRVPQRPVAEHAVAGRTSEKTPSLFSHSRETTVQERARCQVRPLRQLPREQGCVGARDRHPRARSGRVRAGRGPICRAVPGGYSAGAPLCGRGVCGEAPQGHLSLAGLSEGLPRQRPVAPCPRGRIAEPRVTVTPNFDVHVIAETYPAGILAQLAPLCEMVSQGTSIVLKLTKQKVAAARAASPDLDAAGLLRALGGGELPANIVHELSAWSEHGEKFALYVNCSVLETDQDLPAADPFTVERIAAGIRLVRSPDKLFDELERRELMPVRIKHGDQAFAPLPKSALTRFPKGSAGREKPREPKPRVTLTRMTRVQLVCPDRELLDRLHRLLLECQCPAEIDRPNLTLTYSKQYESAVANAIRQLKTEYRLEIEDISS